MSKYSGEDDLSCIVALAISQYAAEMRRELTAMLKAQIPRAEIRRYLSANKFQQAEIRLRACQQASIQVIPISSVRYPYRLMHIPAPPSAIFVRSLDTDWHTPHNPLAIVGTRAASVEVCALAIQVSMRLRQAGFSIVSGLALGIDGAAHRGALIASTSDNLSGEAPTVAIMAHGLDTVYPQSHTPLAQEIIAAGGALISEYPPSSEPYKQNFLERNRIIAGISQGVVVIQAGSRSGSLVTARYAADFGRDVFVYQPPDHDERHSGGAQMIEDGAIAFTCAADILRGYGLSVQPEGEAGEGAIYSLDLYAQEHKLNAADILRLELADKIVRLPGNRIRVNTVC